MSWSDDGDQELVWATRRLLLTTTLTVCERAYSESLTVNWKVYKPAAGQVTSVAKALGVARVAAAGPAVCTQRKCKR